MKIYTKTGDQGETSLLGGARVRKSDARVCAYGALDELNSFIGQLVAEIEKLPSPQGKLHETQVFLTQVQRNLFTFGSHAASPRDQRIPFNLPKLKSNEWTRDLENQIDQMEADLPALKNFILPGGSSAGSIAHILRCVCRRAEREIVAWQEIQPEEIPEGLEIYANRLSDYFFVLARYLNQELQIPEAKWP